ncbi:replication restart DNA helicase PriA [Verrucomicrobium sp. GAS474]|uniref:replication restart helicase PriA n=1 Tax=Verrucomicrobium sp. GAS474 TaxID=1882831 RepID=UPI00087B4F7D|nr:primosomal protein N' [Verrucomicrobium sp. GAS474]SDT91860.1 replication restart DNA helicase PriA [Verrucomicrobium sp. GAS474]
MEPGLFSDDCAYVRVVPENSRDRAYDYAVPDALRGRVGVGMRVRMPLRNAETSGIVIETLARTGYAKIRAITGLVGETPVVPPSLFALARWMADYYCAPLALALRCILPEPVRAEAGALVRLWVAVRPDVGDETVELALGKAKKQLEAWRWLREKGPGWLGDLCGESGIGRAVWQGLRDRGFVSIENAERERDPFLRLPDPVGAEHEPNAAQAAALAMIAEEGAKHGTAEKPRPILLHGVTGSGKTEVYLRAIAAVLDAGKSALMIVPEIALTPQAVERFRARFLGKKVRVAVLHSGLSRGERYDQWRQIREGRARIVIGARSAIFAPAEDLGLIVVDEEHEGSYKQEEAPYYHGRDLAVMRAHLEGIPIVLGSATPSLETFHNAGAEQGKYRMVRLPARVAERPMPLVHVIDLRQKGKPKDGEPPPSAAITPRLREAVEKRLERHEQTLLYLNRRGHSTTLQCPECGHVEMCPHCSLSLTFHRSDARLRCHLCDHVAAVPSRCPACAAPGYRYGGQGTQKIEEAVEQAFPKARILRMDSDSMRGKDVHHQALAAFAAGEVDILVGTQMIAKGLDFPKVTCVGVINVDGALQIPDFRAGERVFQQLMQVAGRAGRAETKGEVFIQTRTPFHPAIQYARHHDYDGFAEQELEFRKALGYPPYRRAILVRWKGKSEEKTRFVAEQIGRKIAEGFQAVGANGAKLGEAQEVAPASIVRIDGLFRFNQLLLTTRVPEAARFLTALLADPAWEEEVKTSVDVDPLMVG